MNPIFKSPQARNAMISIAMALLLIFVFLVPRNPGPYRAIPDHISLLIEFNGMAMAGKQTSELKNSDWKKLLNQSVFAACWSEIAQMENLVHHQSTFKRAFARNRLLAAFTLNPADSLHPLFILDLGTEVSLQQWLEEQGARYFPYQFHGKTLYTVYLANMQKIVLAQRDRQLLFSRYSYLVEDGISQLEQPRNWWSNRKLLGELAPEAPLRCIFRPKQWLKQFNGSLQPDAWKSSIALAENLEWIGLGWDGEQVRMACESAGFLSKTAKWNGTSPHEMLQFLPDNTAAVLWAGFDNRSLFFEHLKSGRSPDFDHFMLPWLDRAVAMIATEPLSTALKDDRLLIVGVSDEAKADKALRAFGDTRGMIARGQIGMFDIFGFQDGSLISPFFTDPEMAFNNPYCAILGEYAVFAPNRPALELFLEKYISNQTLAQNPDLLSIAGNWDPLERGVVLLNNGYLAAFVQQFFSKKAQPTQAQIQNLSAVGWLGFQFKPSASNLVHIQPTAQPLSMPLPPTDIFWKAPLSAPVTAGVFKVEQPGMEQGVRLLVQDMQSDLYCFQPDGVESWRRRIGGGLLSVVYGVDHLGSGRLCYVFNTQTHLWMLDEHGKNVQGFPIKLNSPAIAAVCLADFDKNRRPCYFIPCANGHIYGFDDNGRPLEGWNPMSQTDNCPHPLVHFQHQGKDFLATLSQKGQLAVFGRDGQLRFPAKNLSGKFTANPAVMTLDGKPNLLCINQSGVVFSCFPDGKITEAPLGSGFQEDATIRLSVHNLGIAVAAGKKVTLFKKRQQSWKPAFTVQLPESPSLVQWVGTQIGLVSPGNKKMMMLDEKGAVVPGFPLAGSSSFVGIQSGNQPLLVTGNGSAVFAYKVKLQ